MPISNTKQEHSNGSLQDSPRILFALTPEERSTLSLCLDGDAFSSAQILWADLATHGSREGWESLLKEFRPTILVSWWRTPSISSAYLSAHSIPLRYICHIGGSVRKIVDRGFVADGGIVTNWGNLIQHTVAEHALFLILASLRRLHCWYPSSMTATPELWAKKSTYKTRSLRERKVGIHGFGSIARELVKMMKPFDVKCSAYSENVPHASLAECGVTPCKSLRELFAENDIVVECAALTPKTVGMITEELFRLMPEHAVFVNIARGAIVDENAMVKVAAEGRIRIASDVFVTEPLPASSPLRNLEDAIISPHLGGPTSDWYPHCGAFALQNIRRYLTGEPLEAIVTTELYDRST